MGIFTRQYIGNFFVNKVPKNNIKKYLIILVTKDIIPSRQRQALTSGISSNFTLQFYCHFQAIGQISSHFSTFWGNLFYWLGENFYRPFLLAFVFWRQYSPTGPQYWPGLRVCPLSSIYWLVN